MKTICFLLLSLPVLAFTQTPQAFNYQGVLRNSNGTIMASQALIARFTLHQSSAAGLTVYQETFNLTTNSLGLFVAQIGTGAVVFTSV